MQGVVVDFHAHRGFGTIRADDGREFFFHCTSIADGTRDIAQETRVAFVVVPGHHGRWEAADVRPLGSAPPAGTSARVK